MTPLRAALHGLRALVGRALGAPILVKVLAIGACTAVLFGAIILIQIRYTVSRTLQGMLENRALTDAEFLAAQVERPLVTRDFLAVRETLRQHRKKFPDIRYVVVRDRDYRVVAHSFCRGLPGDLAAAQTERGQASQGVVVYSEGSGLVFEAKVPILCGHAGTLLLGLSDGEVVAARRGVTDALLWALLLALALKIGLGYLLAHVVTGPIERLHVAADRIRDGDFSARAPVEWSDEVGDLAASFNRMADRLLAYRLEVQDKDRSRQELIQKLIQVQEEERKSIGLELHDQLGQSLLALLLTVQSHRGQQPVCNPPQCRCHELERRLLTLIDDVRRLAWGMRPSILDDYGLDSALGQYAQEVTRASGVDLDYQYSAPAGAGRLPAGVEITLFRIAQEAVTNVLRHAKVSRASVVVLQGRTDVRLIVEDVGGGFDGNGPRHDGRPSLGLAGMAERAALLGGTCSVESVPGRGTTVRVRIPLAPEEAPCPSAL